MIIGRALTPSGTTWIRRDGDTLVPIEDPFVAFAAGREPADEGTTTAGTVTTPVDPVLVIGLAQNGPAHESPVQAWLKNPRSVVADGTTVQLRQDAGVTFAEAEIAVVLGRDLDGLTAENAHEYVLGITAVNDLSSPERMQFDPRNYEGKAGVGYTPLGAFIDTTASIDTVAVALLIDGEVAAASDAASLPVSIRDCLVYLAHWGGLGAGDVIMTGAPFTGHEIQSGATVTVRVGDITLTTPTK